MNLKSLAYPDALSMITDQMLTSDECWYSLVYYRPWKAITNITTRHYLELDEPGFRLSKEAMKLVNEFSGTNKDFVIFPSLENEERGALVEEFISSLPQVKKDTYTEKWKQRGQGVLDNWRPSAIYSFLGNEEDTLLWEKFRNEKLEPAVLKFASENNIDLHSLNYYILQ